MLPERQETVSRLSSVWLPVAITAAAYLLFILVRLQHGGWDPSCFVEAGDAYANASQTPQGLKVARLSDGYDGQFYYRLALNPFTRKGTDYGIGLDSPAYWQQRILYPTLVWILTFGRPGLVPVGLILVNYLGLCIMAWCGARLARSSGLHSLWGLAFPFYPGFVLTLARDLPEIVAVSCLLATFLLLRRQRHVAAAVLMFAALMAKETSLPVLVSAGIVYFMEARRPGGVRSLRWPFLVLPALLYGLWQIFLLSRWGSLAFLDWRRFATFPLVELSRPMSIALRFGIGDHILLFFEFYFLVAAFIVVAWSWRSSSASRHEKVSWLLYAALATMLCEHVWSKDWGFLPALSEFYAIGMLLLIGSRPSLRNAIASGSAVLWLALFLMRR